MLKHSGLLAVMALVPFAIGAAVAADEKPGRYTMTPTEGGMLKLDTATGVVSLCARDGGEWSCKLTKDGESTMRKEIDGLKAEIDVLKDQLKTREDIAGPGDPDKGGGKMHGTAQLPSEKDVDQAFDYFEKMVKKLRERLNRIENENKPGTPL